MKSLEEHNREIKNKRNFSKKNGIACPKCGKELFDTDPLITLMSSPPQKDVHCNYCDYKGTRYI